jgi:hypothetical protein
MRNRSSVSPIINIIFVVVFVLILAQLAFYVWIGSHAISEVKNGNGVKGIVEAVWCGQSSGAGINCGEKE